MTGLSKAAVAVLAGLCLAGGAPAGTTVDLTADASRPAANDLVRATVFAEARGSNRPNWRAASIRRSPMG